jgi:hypothetical protein
MIVRFRKQGLITCRTHGIGPKITAGWEKYFATVRSGESVAGVDSLGDLVQTDLPAGNEEKRVYGRMMKKWEKLLLTAADGAAETAEAVAQTIHDALGDAFLQPNYTVGYDALLGQMARDLMPETVWEWTLQKTFE